jgi:hypothetical protein
VSRAYWNGLAWTSFADLRAITFIFSFLYMTSYLMIGSRIFLLYMIAISFFGVSFVFSIISTRRHMEIGNEQIDYILVHYRQDLAEKLKQVAGRSD